VSIPRPEDHTADYNRAIKMIEMHEGDTITLGEDEFAQLVMDDWAWKRQFLDSSAMYSLSAARLAREYE
jgi:hypothetical protein